MSSGEDNEHDAVTRPRARRARDAVSRSERAAETDDRDAERTIARFRAELVAEAELARADLDELEDHLRALYAGLREAGLPRAEAIAQACARLGDPRALAREHARVRSPFGATLPRARAWSAAVLLAPWLVMFAREVLRSGGPGLPSMFGLNLVLGTVTFAGLVTRRTWARAILVGVLSWWIVDLAVRAIGFADAGWLGDPRRIACLAGAFVFVLPWRRRELAWPGLAIAALAWSYHGACTFATYELTAPGQLPLASPALAIAVVGVLAAGVGTIVRARWTAPCAAAAAIALAIGIGHLHALAFRSGVERALVLGSLLCAAAAAALVAALAWRHRTPRPATLRHVLD